MTHHPLRFLNLLLLLVTVGSLDLWNGSPGGLGANCAPLQPRTRTNTAQVNPERYASLTKLGNRVRVGIVIKDASQQKDHPVNVAAPSSSTSGFGRRSSFDDLDLSSELRQRRVLPLRHVGGDAASWAVDPTILLQRHINRATTKLAQMQRRTPPSRRQLLQALQRRHAQVNLQRRSSASPPSPSSVSPLAARVATKASALKAPGRARIGLVISSERTPVEQRRSYGSPLIGMQQILPSSPVTPPQGLAAASRTKTSTAPSATAAGYPQKALDAANSEELKKASPVDAAQSLGLDIEANDVGYVATVQIGSKATSFKLLVDSGSADTWVASTSCQDCGTAHQRLGSTTSDTFRSVEQSKFDITYGTGSVSGTLARDDLSIAGLKLANQTIGLATKQTQEFSDPSVPFDGLMGLAKQSLSNSNAPTPIDSLFASKLVAAPVMGYRLGRAADESNDGEVTFGGVDAAKYVAPFTEIPNVSTLGFWEIAIDGVAFGGKPIASLSVAASNGTGNDAAPTSGSGDGSNGGAAQRRTAILDTGTTLIVAPQADADAVHAAIDGAKPDGQGGYTLPCNTTASLSLTLGGQTFTMQPSDMTFLPVDLARPDAECISSISAGDVGQANEWLVGAAFLKNVYFATNAQTNTIGLAKVK